MIIYSADGKNAVYCGYKFRKDPKTGYFLCSKNTDIGKRERLHCFVWRKSNGDIPCGYHIHHKDENKDNNELANLECVLQSDHATLHGINRAKTHYNEVRENLMQHAMPASKAWHSSAEGRAWHTKHAKEAAEKWEKKEYVCRECGKRYFAFSVGGEHKYCSNACKSTARRKAGIDNETRKCEFCGAEFTANRYSTRKYCSRECAVAIRKDKEH